MTWQPMLDKTRVRYKMSCTRCKKTNCKTTQIEQIHNTEDGPMYYYIYLCDLCRGMREL